jgi:hypothetical protein
VKGHSSLQGNEESDKLTKEGAEKEQHEELNPQIPTEFDIQDLRLGIRENKHKLQRQSTMENLQTTREAIEAICGTTETDAKIWTTEEMKLYVYMHIFSYPNLFSEMCLHLCVVCSRLSTTRQAQDAPSGR